MTIEFQPTTLMADVGSATAKQIFVCAHDDAFELEFDPNNDAPEKVNHWAMYVQINAGKTKSVKIDMGVGDGAGVMNPNAPVGLLEISGLEEEVPERVVKYNIVECNGTVTVNDLVSAVLESGYDKYDFHETAIGCRYWTKCALELFRDKGLIEEESSAAAIDGLAKAWREDGQEYVPAIPLQKGTFHSSE